MAKFMALVYAVLIAGSVAAQNPDAKPDPELERGQKCLSFRRDLAEATVLKFISKVDVGRFDKAKEKVLPKWDEGHFIHAESIRQRVNMVAGTSIKPGTPEWAEVIKKQTSAGTKETDYPGVRSADWTFNAYVKGWPRPKPPRGPSPMPQWKLTLYVAGEPGAEKVVGWELSPSLKSRVVAYKEGDIPVFEPVPEKQQVLYRKLPKK
jgi:hypothetical protein